MGLIFQIIIQTSEIEEIQTIFDNKTVDFSPLLSIDFAAEFTFTIAAWCTPTTLLRRRGFECHESPQFDVQGCSLICLLEFMKLKLSIKKLLL